MTKTDVLDEVIEILIKKAVEDEQHMQNSGQKLIERIAKGEKVNGLPSASGKRK
ncbi:MAG: hypothetical protein K0R50_4808 [Eubacterium sp.]|jgi:hypothetical protein|nr:hypothetical protein [Eubacterium sp.]